MQTFPAKAKKLLASDLPIEPYFLRQQSMFCSIGEVEDSGRMRYAKLYGIASSGKSKTLRIALQLAD